jgi:hypothetical protein
MYFFFYKTKTKSNIFLIKLYLISKSLIIIPTQSLRFDTLSIALSNKDSFYCEWLILLLIYFGKQKTTSSGNEAGGISCWLAGAEVHGCNKHSLVLLRCCLVLYLNFCCKLLVDVVFCLLKYINNNNYHS